MRYKNKQEMNAEMARLVAEFSESGGEIIMLREASKSDIAKAERKFHHISKSMEGDERSQAIIQRENDKERRLVFSRTDRWRVD
jgi:hypothetical protein